jgi:Uma2 family endonuclease
MIAQTPAVTSAPELIQPKPIEYPDSDGQPMADNTKQFQWIQTIHSNLAALFANDPQVFVAGDLLWYPIEGDNKTRQAPNVMVVFGVPKGDRGSYMQWRENHIAPQVVFEILSPGNRLTEMLKKQLFYDRYGVEEYYLYDPDRNDLSALIRGAEGPFEPVDDPHDWVSPRLGIRFQWDDDTLTLLRPDGQPFSTLLEERQRAEQAQQQAEQERQRAEQAQQQAEQERQRAEQAQQRAEQERERADRLAARLRELGLDPETIDS